jgi:radical SAM-linked protein
MEQPLNSATNMTVGSLRWMISFAVEDDLRFLSHHDMMRAMERIALRVRLPLRYSQGFNPRPRMSLPIPRPVGVASRDDRLILTLDAPPPDDALNRMNAVAPPGLTFSRADLLDAKGDFRPVAIEYRLVLRDEEAPQVRERLAELQSQDEWRVQRRRKIKSRRGRRGEFTHEPIDLKPLLSAVWMEEHVLLFRCATETQQQAKPGEVLSLFSLAAPEDLARLVRTNIL